MLKKLLNQLFGNSNNSELASILNQNPFLVDVRSPAEFKSGSVKGAVNIPLDKIATESKAFKGKANIVVFCRSGNRSAQAKTILNRQGFNNVSNGGTFQNVNNLLSKSVH